MGDINSVSNLDDNVTRLLAKKAELDNIKPQVEKRSKRFREGDDGWLHKAEHIEDKTGEIQSKLIELNQHGFYLFHYVKDRHQLNQKVIEILNAVEMLIKAANACPELIHAFLSKIKIGRPREFSGADIKTITSHFSKSKKIRSDLFGKVYKSMLDGKQLSVKVLVNEDVSHEIFMSEVTTLSNTSHRHLTKLYGYCFEHGIIALVYEYMENGSFAELLFQNHSTVDWDMCYGIATKTAKAIAYLHDGCDDQIIHLDIKPDNVLLDKNYSPKVAAFGVAKLIKEGRSHLTLTNPRGTSYAAPEMWIKSSRVTCASDVYSFGIMLFDILAMGKFNEKRRFTHLVWNKFENGQLDDLLEDCGIIEKDEDKARTLAKLALRCIHHSPEERPSMSTVVKVLEMEMPGETPIKPFRS